MSERKFAVSTDSSSLTGIPQHWKEVWKPALDHQNFSGFEMIAWRWSRTFSYDATRMGLKIIGVHGRTGGLHDSYPIEDRAVSSALNMLLIPTPDLFRDFGNSKRYVLVHSPEMRSSENRASVTSNSDGKTLMLENHVRLGALGAAVETARELRNKGVNAAGTAHHKITYETKVHFW